MKPSAPDNIKSSNNAFNSMGRKLASGPPVQDLNFPKLGITMGGIRDFIKMNGGEAAMASLTTGDVCEKVNL